MIVNYSAILSDDILQSIGNSVQTSIFSLPSIDLNVTPIPDTLPAGETFDLLIDYYNNSDGIADNMSIKVFLPESVIFFGVEHARNTVSRFNGLPAGTTDLSGNIALSSGTSSSGTWILLDIDTLRDQTLLGSGVQPLE